MADNFSLSSAVSSFLRNQSAAFVGGKNPVASQPTVIDQQQLSNGTNRIASSDKIAEAINSRNLPRGSLINILV